MIKIEKLENSWLITTTEKNLMIKCKSKGLIQSMFNFNVEPQLNDFVEVAMNGEQYVEVSD